MKKQWKKIFAMMLSSAVILSCIPAESFAAAGTGSIKGETREIGQVALYQDGALSAAYSEGEGTEKYTAPEEGTVEAALYNGLKNFDEKIDLSAYKLSIADAEETFRKLINSNPDLFYVSNIIDYTYSTALLYCDDCGGWVGQTADGKWIMLESAYATQGRYCDHQTTHSCYTAVSEWTPHYIAAKPQLKEMTAKFDAAVETALSGIDESMTNLEKALYCHDYIEKVNTYDYKNYLNDTVPDSSHSAYGALVLNTSVCDGYSLAFSYLMNKCGIPTRLVSSESMGHAWNAIELDGSWYFLDLTYDDAIKSYTNADPSDAFDVVGHGGFLSSESKLSSTRYNKGYYHGWAQTDIVADNTRYDEAVWKNISDEYGYCDGNWYYLDSNTKEIMKTEDPTQAGTVYSSIIKEAAGKWQDFSTPDSWYKDSFGKASVHAASKVMYVSVANEVYSLDLTKATAEPVFFVGYTGEGSIYGLTVIGDYIYIGVANSYKEKEQLFYEYLGARKKGDVNGDGNISAEDALDILKNVVGLIEFDEVQKESADTTSEGEITSEDALLILKFVVGLVTEI